jgi:hypothetical protein
MAGGWLIPAPARVARPYCLKRCSTTGRIRVYAAVEAANDRKKVPSAAVGIQAPLERECLALRWVTGAREPENREPDKCKGLRWFPLGALPDHLIPYCRAAVTRIVADQCFSTYGWKAADHGAASRRNVVSAPAFRAEIRHTHCAGAAFSGGLIYGLLHDWPMQDCLELASASGALRCEREQGDPMPTLSELRGVMRPPATRGCACGISPSALINKKHQTLGA